jgi:hypothetical protein
MGVRHNPPMNKRFFAILSTGILLTPVFPTSGIRTLTTKILERILFNLGDNITVMAVIAGTIGLSISIYVFQLSLSYFSKFDYNEQTDIWKAFRIAAFIFVGYELIWMAIPFIDFVVGTEYIENLNSSYDSFNTGINYYTLISTAFWMIGAATGVIMLYHRIKTVANIH